MINARASLEKALKVDSNSAQVLWRMGDVDRLENKTVQALANYRRAITIEPDLPEAQYGMGQVAMLMAQKDEAILRFTLVVNNPKSSPELKTKAQDHLRTLGVK